MKFLVAVACVAFVAVVYAEEPPNVPEEQRAKAQAISQECISEQKISPEAVELLHKGEFASADQKGKCFINCLLSKSGVLIDGKIKEEQIKALLEPVVGEEKRKTVMGKCNSLKGVDHCDTALKLFECYYKNDAAYM